MYKCLFLMIILSGFILGNVSSQEIVWSTVELDVNNSGKHIGLSQVREEIMTLYSNYRYYYDDTGYDIDYFLQAFGPGFMIAHLPKSAMAMKMTKDGYEQIQVLFFVLYNQYRIAGCFIFSNDGRGAQAVEATSNNREGFISLLDSQWFDIAGIDYR